MWSFGDSEIYSIGMVHPSNSASSGTWTEHVIIVNCYPLLPAMYLHLPLSLIIMCYCQQTRLTSYHHSLQWKYLKKACSYLLFLYVFTGWTRCTGCPIFQDDQLLDWSTVNWVKIVFRMLLRSWIDYNKLTLATISLKIYIKLYVYLSLDARSACVNFLNGPGVKFVYRFLGLKKGESKLWLLH